MTSDNAASAPVRPETEIWSVPPLVMNAHTQDPINPNNQRLYNANAPPPVFNVSSLQAPPPVSTTGGGSGNAAGYQRQPSGGRAAAVATAPSPLALLDEHSEGPDIMLDAAKRKNLPAWIR